jgi:hypothetical protein
MNRSLTVFGSAFLSVGLVMGCNHGPASNAAADSNADQNTQAKGDAANGPEKGVLGSLFESKKEITIPEGTPFEVTLDETLASNRNHAGDSFAASLSRPVVEDGKTIIPAGALVAGRVVERACSSALECGTQLRGPPYLPRRVLVPAENDKNRHG